MTQPLRALPTKYRVTSPDGRASFDDLLVVHASPRSCNDLLVLEPHPLGTTFTRLTPTGDAEAMLGGEKADLIVFGHIYYASSGNIWGAAPNIYRLGRLPFRWRPEGRLRPSIVGRSELAGRTLLRCVRP